MRARRTLAVVAVAVLTCGGWITWLARDRGGAPPSEERVVADAAPSAAPLLARNVGNESAVYRIEDGVGVPQGAVSAKPGVGVVIVRVVDDQDGPVAGVTVGALQGSDGLRLRRTDLDGVVRWSGMPTGGIILVRVEDDDWTSGMGWFHVAAGDALRTLRVVRTARVVVRVTDRDGTPVSRASVHVYGRATGNGRPEAVNVARKDRTLLPQPGLTIAAAVSGDAEGRASVGVPTGLTRGTLWVTAEGYAPWADLDWSPRDTDVRLELARDIEGVVRDTNGGAVTDGVIVWETAQGIRGKDPVEYDGAFRIAGLPSGSIRLEWRLDDAPALDGRNVRHAAAGDGPVTFVVAALGADLAVRIEGWPREPGGEAFLTPQDAFASSQLRADIDLEGNARFLGLEPELSYVLWVPPRRAASVGRDGSEQRVTVYRTDVTASADTLTVALEPGRTIRGVIDLAETGAIDVGEWRWPSVSVRGPGVLVKGSASDVPHDAREVPFEVTGVPRGAFTVVVTMTAEFADDRPSAVCIGDAPLPTNEEPVRVRLRPAPAPGRARR